MAMTADQWNANYPIGTPVFAWPGARDEAPLATRTRASAWTLGHGEPVVSVQGYAGGISLDHIEPRESEIKPQADGDQALRLVGQLSPETRERIAQLLHDSFHAITGIPRA